MGTREGGKKAMQTNYERHGGDFYRWIGSKGGSSKKRKGAGFASEKVGKDGLTGRERAKIAGAKGGANSARTGIRNGEGQVHQEKKYLWETLSYE